VTEMSAYEKLSNLERERVDSEAIKAVRESFQAMHEATGWCGDLERVNWDAALPVIKEAMAVLVLSYRLIEVRGASPGQEDGPCVRLSLRR